jgi:hypothetical protein
MEPVLSIAYAANGILSILLMAMNIFLIQMLKGSPGFTAWLQQHLLPCPFKQITGIDCPFCGFQRSALALFDGDLHRSFLLYPPLVPLIMFIIYSVVEALMKIKPPEKTLKKAMVAGIALLVLINYAIKLWTLQGR